MDRQCGRGHCSPRAASERFHDPKDAGVGYSQPVASFQASLPSRLDKSHPPLTTRAKGEGAYHLPMSHKRAPTQRQSRLAAAGVRSKVAWTDTPEVHLEYVFDFSASHQYTNPCRHICQAKSDLRTQVIFSSFKSSLLIAQKTPSP
jgi:hypothetical protein